MKQSSKGTGAYALMLLMTLTAGSSALAQEEVYLEEGVDVYNSEQIDIDGAYGRRDSAANRISEMRKKLERENNALMKKKIEGIRIEQEQELSQRLSGALRGERRSDSYDDSSDRYDQVRVLSAAPQRVETVVGSENDNDSSFLGSKITPYIGRQNFNGDKIDSFDSNATIGLQFESMLSNYFSVGAGGSFTTMDITYIENSTIFNYYNSIGYTYSTADEIDYRNLNLNVNAKLYLANNSKIKPFLGVQAEFNRTNLRFTEKGRSYINNYGQNFEDDSKVSASNVSATGIVGIEFAFSKNVGLVGDFRYSKALTTGFDTVTTRFASNNNQIESDKKVLEDIGSRLENSDIAAINLGLTVKF